MLSQKWFAKEAAKKFKPLKSSKIGGAKENPRSEIVAYKSNTEVVFTFSTGSTRAVTGHGQYGTVHLSRTVAWAWASAARLLGRPTLLGPLLWRYFNTRWARRAVHNHELPSFLSGF